MELLEVKEKSKTEKEYFYRSNRTGLDYCKALEKMYIGICVIKVFLGRDTTVPVTKLFLYDFYNLVTVVQHPKTVSVVINGMYEKVNVEIRIDFLKNVFSIACGNKNSGIVKPFIEELEGNLC